MQILELFGGNKVKVSDDSRIFSMARTVTRNNGRLLPVKEKELKASIDKYGYKHVVLSFNGTRKTYTVHQLVAKAFIPNTYNKPTVNHIDGNKQNNIVDNLEWATYKEQKKHAIRNNLCDKNIKALTNHNKATSIKVIYKGNVYSSIRKASRENKVHERVIKREGVVLE